MRAHHGTNQSRQSRAVSRSISETSPVRKQILELQRTAGNAAVSRILQGPDCTLQRAGTGLAGQKVSKKYAKTVKKSHGDWGGRGIQLRMSDLIKPANDALDKLGVPPVMPIRDPFEEMHGTADRASFNPALWQVRFNPDFLTGAIDDETFARLANTAYHECRHAEQTFRVARKLATEGMDVPTIARSISIPQQIADAAAKNPLPRKNKDEWAEAAAWEFNIIKTEAGVVRASSRADDVNAQKDVKMRAYNDARGVWRTFERVINDDPGVDPALKAAYRNALATPDGAARMEAKAAELKRDYNEAREQAKQAYLQYARMPVEQDAWSTGGLIQQHLGRKPAEADDELANLDKDERSMVPTGLFTLSSGSAREQELFAAIKGKH